jgi:hypothetical protein
VLFVTKEMICVMEGIANDGKGLAGVTVREPDW